MASGVVELSVGVIESGRQRISNVIGSDVGVQPLDESAPSDIASGSVGVGSVGPPSGRVFGGRRLAVQIPGFRSTVDGMAKADLR